LGNAKKIIKGLRRRRNWLMRTGQWPAKERMPIDKREIVR
jgi:hypothetical protein